MKKTYTNKGTAQKKKQDVLNVPLPTSTRVLINWYCGRHGDNVRAMQGLRYAIRKRNLAKLAKCESFCATWRMQRDGRL